MTETTGTLPTIPFGPHQVSRLILGANPINGGSHLSRFVNMQMKRYFSPECIQQLLAHCAALGINTWQSNHVNLDDYARFTQSGGAMHYISLGHEDAADPGQLARIAAAGAIGVAHHGEVTDRFWKNGEIERVREYGRIVRDTGLRVGVSTHIPDVVDHIVGEGWDVDFFMCCVYERHRTREELQALLGHVPLPLREVYLESDPPRMYAAIQQAPQTCLAFKILAAGRLCDQPELVERAFEEALRGIKPTDAVIVGMYPEYEDQAALNAEYVRRFGHLSGSKGA